MKGMVGNAVYMCVCVSSKRFPSSSRSYLLSFWRFPMSGETCVRIIPWLRGGRPLPDIYNVLYTVKANSFSVSQAICFLSPEVLLSVGLYANSTRTR